MTGHVVRFWQANPSICIATTDNAGAVNVFDFRDGFDCPPRGMPAPRDVYRGGEKRHEFEDRAGNRVWCHAR